VFSLKVISLMGKAMFLFSREGIQFSSILNQRKMKLL